MNRYEILLCKKSMYPDLILRPEHNPNRIPDGYRIEKLTSQLMVNEDGLGRREVHINKIKYARDRAKDIILKKLEREINFTVEKNHMLMDYAVRASMYAVLKNKNPDQILNYE